MEATQWDMDSAMVGKANDFFTCLFLCTKIVMFHMAPT